ASGRNMAHPISKPEFFNSCRLISAADNRVSVLGFSKRFGNGFRSSGKLVHFKHTHRAVPNDELGFFIDFRVKFFCFRSDVKSLPRSEEHTSELQSRENLVCRLLLEKK